jgi:hypothetical protein
MFTRFTRVGLMALVSMFAAVNFAGAKGFGGGNGGGKSFAQKFFSNNNNNQPKTANLINNKPNKQIAFKQDNKPSKSFSSDCKQDKCHDKCCYHRCHYCYDYGYCGWGFCDDFDLQVLSVQMLDGGNPAGGMGPMFRVTFRNNSFASINRPFSLSLVAIADPTTGSGIPAAVRVRGIGAFQVAAVNIRMPIEAIRPGMPMLQAIVDSHREIGETNKSNNVLMVKLAEVRPVETKPAAPAVEAPAAPAAETLSADAQAEIAKEPMADEQDN